MNRAVFFLVAFFLSFFLSRSWAEQSEVVEGVDYIQFERAESDSSENREQVKEASVIEFFSYGCKHCRKFLPSLDSWGEVRGIDVQYMPVIWSEETELYAKAFYLSKAQENFEELHKDLFDVISHFTPTDTIEEKKIALISWFQKKGVEPIDTLNEFSGDVIEEQLALSVFLVKHYKVSTVPTLLINKRYKINNEALNNQQEILDIASILIRK